MDLFRKFGIEKKKYHCLRDHQGSVRERKDYVALKILGYDLTRPHDRNAESARSV